MIFELNGKRFDGTTLGMLVADGVGILVFCVNLFQKERLSVFQQ